MKASIFAWPRETYPPRSRISRASTAGMKPCMKCPILSYGLRDRPNMSWIVKPSGHARVGIGTAHDEHESVDDDEDVEQGGEGKPAPRRPHEDKADHYRKDFEKPGDAVVGMDAREGEPDDQQHRRGDERARRRAHFVNFSSSFVQRRACSLSVKPRPGRCGTCMRPSASSRRSLNSGSSHSKCSTHGSRG